MISDGILSCFSAPSRAIVFYAVIRRMLFSMPVSALSALQFRTSLDVGGDIHRRQPSPPPRGDGLPPLGRGGGSCLRPVAPLLNGSSTGTVSPFRRAWLLLGCLLGFVNQVFINPAGQVTTRRASVVPQPAVCIESVSACMAARSSRRLVENAGGRETRRSIGRVAREGSTSSWRSVVVLAPCARRSTQAQCCCARAARHNLPGFPLSCAIARFAAAVEFDRTAEERSSLSSFQRSRFETSPGADLSSCRASPHRGEHAAAVPRA